jgi:hypothetical protein
MGFASSLLITDYGSIGVLPSQNKANLLDQDRHLAFLFN